MVSFHQAPLSTKYSARIGDAEVKLLDDAERGSEVAEVEPADADTDVERVLESDVLEDEA